MHAFAVPLPPSQRNFGCSPSFVTFDLPIRPVRFDFCCRCRYSLSKLAASSHSDGPTKSPAKPLIPSHPTVASAIPTNFTNVLKSVVRRIYDSSIREPFIRSRLLLAIVCALVSKLCLIFVPFLLKRAIDSVMLSCCHTTTIVLLFASYCTTKVAANVLHVLHISIFSSAAFRLARRFSREMFDTLHTLGSAWYAGISTGSVTHLVNRGGVRFMAIIRILLFTFVPSIIEFVLVVVVLGARGWWSTIGPFVAVAALYSWWTRRMMEELGMTLRTMSLASAKTSGKLTDFLINYEGVLMFGRDQFEAKRYDSSLKMVEDVRVKNDWQYAVLNIGQDVIFTVGLAFVLYMALPGVMSTDRTVGDVIMIATMLRQLWIPLSSAGMLYLELKQNLVDMHNLFQLVNVQPTVKEVEGAKELQITGGEIVFDHVSFSYPRGGAHAGSVFARGSTTEPTEGSVEEVSKNSDSKANRAVVHDLTFRVPPGKTFAIIGGSGSGKSTVLSLLLRLYDVDGGRILIDGQDISQVSLSSLRNSIAVVPQDTILFNDTIAYNIEYGRPGATIRDVIAAAKAANIHDTILSMKYGYNTFCGERGVRLSGGERQRLNAARAILKDSKIVLQDEATSELDSKTELEVATALKTLGKSKTMLVVAHRLSAISDADWILVMKDGAIIEEGTHQSLLKTEQGIYKVMWELQQVNARRKDTEGT